jgi:hypothetical protein
MWSVSVVDVGVVHRVIRAVLLEAIRLLHSALDPKLGQRCPIDGT